MTVKGWARLLHFLCCGKEKWLKKKNMFVFCHGHKVIPLVWFASVKVFGVSLQELWIKEAKKSVSECGNRGSYTRLSSLLCETVSPLCSASGEEEIYTPLYWLQKWSQLNECSSGMRFILQVFIVVLCLEQDLIYMAVYPLWLYNLIKTFLLTSLLWCIMQFRRDQMFPDCFWILYSIW